MLPAGSSLFMYEGEEWNEITADIPNASAEAAMVVYFYEGSGTGETMLVEHVFVRHFVATEPTFSSWGAQFQSSSNFRLEWEHQATGIDTQKDRYAVCVYGVSDEDSGDGEDFDIRIWNHTSSIWNPTIGNISTQEKWYNYTFEASLIDSGTVTWLYQDTIQTDDPTRGVLKIDYASVTGWNFTAYGLGNFDSLEFSPDTAYYAFEDNPINFTVESGETFDVQIKGIDGVGNPVTNGFIYFNNVDNPGTSTQLTTSYQTLSTEYSAGNTTVYIYLWVNYNWVAGDPAVTNGGKDFEINCTISSSS